MIISTFNINRQILLYISSKLTLKNQLYTIIGLLDSVFFLFTNIGQLAIVCCIEYANLTQLGPPTNGWNNKSHLILLIWKTITCISYYAAKHVLYDLCSMIRTMVVMYDSLEIMP